MFHSSTRGWISCHTVLFLGDYLHIYIYNCFSKKISHHSDDEEEKRDMRHEGMMQHLHTPTIYQLSTLEQLQSKFRYLHFSNPTHKTKTGTSNRWQMTNSKPPGPTIMIGESIYGAAVTLYSLHSSLAGVRLCLAFYQTHQTVQKCWAKTILLSQTSMW